MNFAHEGIQNEDEKKEIKLMKKKRKTLRVNQSNESDLGYIIHGLCGDPLNKKVKSCHDK